MRLLKTLGIYLALFLLCGAWATGFRQMPPAIWVPRGDPRIGTAAPISAVPPSDWAKVGWFYRLVGSGPVYVEDPNCPPGTVRVEDVSCSQAMRGEDCDWDYRCVREPLRDSD